MARELASPSTSLSKSLTSCRSAVCHRQTAERFCFPDRCKKQFTRGHGKSTANGLPSQMRFRYCHPIPFSGAKTAKKRFLLRAIRFSGTKSSRTRRTRCLVRLTFERAAALSSFPGSFGNLHEVPSQTRLYWNRDTSILYRTESMQKAFPKGMYKTCDGQSPATPPIGLDQNHPLHG